MNIQWDVQDYAKQFDFVHKYGCIEAPSSFPKKRTPFSPMRSFIGSMSVIKGICLPI